jgi:hypothetical protein
MFDVMLRSRGGVNVELHQTLSGAVGACSGAQYDIGKLLIQRGPRDDHENVNAEVDRTGTSNAYSLKAGIRF